MTKSGQGQEYGCRDIKCELVCKSEDLQGEVNEVQIVCKNVASSLSASATSTTVTQPGATQGSQRNQRTLHDFHHAPFNLIDLASYSPQMALMDNDIEVARYIMHTGKLNSVCAKVPIKSNWNLRLFQSLCTSQSDFEVLEFLRYGWPLNREPGPVAQTWENHALANRYPQQISNYLATELQHGSMMGPFVTSPFNKDETGVSPMSTRPKKNSDKRRVIVDLSWPINGNSVNSLIPKDSFMGTPIKLIYPTVDLLCKRSYTLGPSQFAWRKDMRRAFHQVPLDPIFYCLLGVYWMGALFFDKAAVMGCRSAPYACQRTTNVIWHFMWNMSYIVYNYIDDFVSIDSKERAWKSYLALGRLLKQLGVDEAEDKVVPPTQLIEVLGVLFDLIRMIIVLPQDKLDSINMELRKWQNRTYMSKKQLQCIAGKLQFAATCVRPGRVFITRMYDKIAKMTDGKVYKITENVRKDLDWWQTYLSTYNGMSIMWMNEREVAENFLTTDASMTGIGGQASHRYFHEEIPGWILKLTQNIAHLEMWAIIVGVRIWSDII